MGLNGERQQQTLFAVAYFLLETGRKLNVHKTFRSRPVQIQGLHTRKSSTTDKDRDLLLVDALHNVLYMQLARTHNIHINSSFIHFMPLEYEESSS